ncbi:response regulator [Mucilaginibacter lacusdianchii]|uniref:response regulator n=1 Tax=Mucilaginibacter lacusdianchii TaxID=2684211 RepID=UPI00131B4684|nr:response regulator [Mucilaginibacter sp. JXJ CY 39]
MNKKKILVCDDDEDILDLVSIVLEDHYEVIVEADSSKLIGKAEALQPDVVLLDMWMPKISGDQLTGYFKKLPKLANVPVIIFSASKDGKEKALAAGANDFIAKPFDIDELVKVVDQHCKAAA